MTADVRRELALGLAAGLLVITATTAIDAVFIGRGWLPLTWGAVALALVVAAGARRLGLGAVAAVVASTVAWAVFTYITQLPADGLLPGAEQARQLAELWSQALTDIVQEPAPARPLPTLISLTASGAWFITHAVHELLVRWRRPGLGLAVAATLWLLPLAAPQPPGRTWPQAVPFLAAAALVLLLDPEPDLRSWRRTGRRPVLPSGAGTAMAVVAILVATLAPGAAPGYGDEPWVDLSAAGAARGYQPIVDVSRRLKLPEERDLLRVRAPRPLYLRLAGLDTFDGTTWRLGPPDERSFSPEDVLPADRPLPPEVPIARAEPVEVRIETLQLENVFVPVPYHPVEIEGRAARRMVYSQDGSFVASSQVLEDEPALVPGLEYGVRSAVPVPHAADLRAIDASTYQDPRFARWLTLPDEYRELREVTERITAGTDNPYDAALAIQRFFRDTGDFRYSLDVDPLRGSAEITQFVTEDRVGYCEYFATAMAIMARLEGIPARVAVGFRPGSEVEPGTFVVTSRDAHAWVEVLFPGQGWISFEPTVALGDALVPTGENASPREPIGEIAEEEQPEEQQNDQLTEQELLREAEREQSDDERFVGGVASAGDATEQEDGAAWPWFAATLLAALLAVGAGAAVRSRNARPRPDLDVEERVLHVQRRVHEAARRYGVGRRRSETPREVALRWSREGRIVDVDAHRLAELAEAAAFGGLVADGGGEEAERLGERVVAGLRASVDRRARLTAPVRVPLDAVTDASRRAVVAVRQRVGR